MRNDESFDFDEHHFARTVVDVRRGAASHPTEGEADPLATRVLNRGEAIVAPRGRADDFSWPRRDISGAADTEALPDAVSRKDAAGNSAAEDGKKNVDKAATTKPSVTTTRPRRHVDQVNGAPRPPLPVGPATSNWR
jgi:hypothetical protein